MQIWYRIWYRYLYRIFEQSLHWAHEQTKPLSLTKSYHICVSSVLHLTSIKHPALTSIPPDCDCDVLYWWPHGTQTSEKC